MSGLNSKVINIGTDSGMTTLAVLQQVTDKSVVDNVKRYFDEIFDQLPSNTKIAYSSDLSLYFQFCQQHQPVLNPLSSDFAEQEDNLLAYIEFQMQTHRKRSVILRHFTSISKLLRIAKIRNPLKDSEHVRDYIRLALNRKDNNNQLIKPAVQTQAKALDRQLLNHINTTFEPQCLKDKRDLALVNFMAHTLLRASEVAQIQISDLNKINHTVFVASTKTDQSGEGCYRFVSPHTISLIDDWLTSAGLFEGPIFARVDPCYGRAQKGAIGYNAIYKIIKSVLSRCGIDPKGFTAHSLRVGAVVEMRRSGMTDSEIMQSGGWRSLVFHRYTAQTEVEFSGAAKLDSQLNMQHLSMAKQILQIIDGNN